MDSPIIKVHDLRKEFKLGSERVEALCGVNLVVQRGEMISIIGPSGSGKSTLLGLIGGLDTPTSGTVVIDGQDISRMNERQLTRIRNKKISFVFQFFNLIPPPTVLENVALPIQFASERRFNPTKRDRELLTRLGLGDRLRHRPVQLSGGQQQRVAIARALAIWHRSGLPRKSECNAPSRSHEMASPTGNSQWRAKLICGYRAA